MAFTSMIQDCRLYGLQSFDEKGEELSSMMQTLLEEEQIKDPLDIYLSKLRKRSANLLPRSLLIPFNVFFSPQMIWSNTFSGVCYSRI